MLCVWHLDGSCRENILKRRTRGKGSFIDNRPELQGKGERFYAGDHTDTRGMGKERAAVVFPHRPNNQRQTNVITFFNLKTSGGLTHFF